MGKLLLPEGSAPDTPGTGYGAVYLNTSPELLLKDDAGLIIKPPYRKGADVASAATINLDTATGDLVDVTGTTTITAITLTEGRQCTVRFTGILTLTHGASLVLPNAGSNITTAVGDYAIFRGYASGIVRCISYVPADGETIAGFAAAATQAEQETASATNVYVSPGRQHFHPGHPKCWGSVSYTTQVPAIVTSYNITSITDTAVGVVTWTIATDFSNGSWTPIVSMIFNAAGTAVFTSVSALAAGSLTQNFYDIAGSAADPGNGSGGAMLGLGDHA